MSTATATPEVEIDVNHAYEGMFLVDSNRYSANADGVMAEVLGLIDRAGGHTVASRQWQDGKLCYPIDGHRKAVYLLTYFGIAPEKLTELRRLIKLNETIIRHLILKLDPALVNPMIAMAQGRGEVISTFKDTSDQSEG